MNLGQAWKALGIARTGNVGAIRRAYAGRLKAMDIDREAQAYSRLRDARDIALRWARQQGDVSPSSPEVAASETQLPAVTPHAWPYAAPVVEMAGGEYPVTVARPDPVTDGFAPLAPGGSAAGELHDVGGWRGDPFTMPVLALRADDADLVQPSGNPGEGLERLLFPGGDMSEAAFGTNEDVRAQRFLTAILADAMASDLSRHDEIEGWLAERLAQTWPRSAPLLARTSDTFGWGNEAGQLGERPGLAFLNARLKGMRFHEKVLDSAHPLHKAWAELSRPGPAGAFKSVRTDRAQINQLMNGVRNHFPELESFWDPQRVTSWENGRTQSARGGGGWSGQGLGTIILVVVFAIRAMIGIGQSSSNTDTAPPVEQSAPDGAELDGAALDIFGPDTTFADVEAGQQDVAQMIAANVRSSGAAARFGGGIPAARDEVRRRMHHAAMITPGHDLIPVQRIRLGLMQAARRTGPDACMAYLRTDSLPPDVDVPVDLRNRERQLTREMLANRKLVPLTRRDPVKAMIPAALIDQVISDTRLSAGAVERAISGKGSDAVICPVLVTLLERTLRWKGRDQRAILQVL